MTTPLATMDAISVLRSMPGVEAVEPNRIIRTEATSDDPHYTGGSLWGMYGDSTTPANQFGSQAGELWAREFTGSSGVYVGVIDEGIDVDHPDLAANIWTNPFDPVDTIDNDGNGFIDDAHGWDFFSNNNSVYDGSAMTPTVDDHGTHVAGTIGARGGNAAGVAGVNWHVTIISAKFIHNGFGLTSDAIDAIDYLTDLRIRHGLNIVATNNSWTVPTNEYDVLLHQAIIRAAKQGILFVTGAGNNSGSDNDAVPRYPANYRTDVGADSESAASYDAVVAVASISIDGARSSFSNFGASTVDLGAPGSGIHSTLPQNSYGSMSGTSMAAPHVTGAVALYKSMNPTASAESVRAAILSQAIPTASLSGVTVTGGRLNVGDFVVTPTSFTDASLTGIPVKAVHISELRTAINNRRVAHGLSSFAFTDPVLTTQVTTVRAVHIAEMRTALDAVYTTLGHSAPSYTDQSLTGVPIKAVHITELRSYTNDAP